MPLIEGERKLSDFLEWARTDLVYKAPELWPGWIEQLFNELEPFGVEYDRRGAEIEQLKPLAQRLAELHRPVKEPFWDAAVPGHFLVQCRACDGPRKRIWAPGDEPYSCELWREALAAGLVAADEPTAAGGEPS